MKMAQQVVSGLKVQHIVFKNPISSGWQNTKNLLYVCEIIFIALCIFDDHCNGNAGKKIAEKAVEAVLTGNIDLKKKFYDL